MPDTALPTGSSLVAQDRNAFRLAGHCLRAATVTLAVAGVSLGLFFGGAGAIFGPINDAFTAATLLLIVPGALATRALARGRVGGWFAGLSVLTVAGIGVAASGLLLLVARAITLNDSFTIGGIGMLPFLAWLAALAFVCLRREVLSPRTGWLAAATLAVALVGTAVSPLLPMNVLVFVVGLPLFAVFAAWLWTFGGEFLEA